MGTARLSLEKEHPPPHNQPRYEKARQACWVLPLEGINSAVERVGGSESKEG